MSAMEKYGLPKSERIWKARFKSWGMFKNLRGNDVRRVARELNARPGRDSEVFLNGKKISMERVQRSLAKRGESGPEAKAASITVQTPPATCVASPGSMGITAKTTACAFFPGGEVKGPFDVQSFRADGRGLSIQELLGLKAKGAKQISDRQLDEAILSLRTALTGLQHAHKSTHPSVVETAWCLVDAYVLNQKVQSGDDIINWISSAYSQDLSLWHPQTLTHYLRVVEKLQARGRGDDAKSLGFRLFAAIRDDMPSTKVIQVRQCSDHDSQFDSVAGDAEFQRIFDERSDIGEIDQQLRLASIWSVSTLLDIYFWKAGGIGPLRIEKDYVLGHEGAGVVVQCAPGVGSLQVGDRVAIEAPMPCENCQFCQSGRRNMCSNLRIIGVYPTDGALQRYMVHPAKLLHKLPDNISFADAALLEPLSVAIQGIRDAGGLPLGSAALICGAGPIGLLTLAAARASGAHPLVITDIELTRLEFAQKLVPSCFTYKVDTSLTPEENAKAIRQLYGPGEYSAPETVLECTGADSSALVGLHAARMSGKLIILGVGKGTFADFPTELMMGKMLSIKYSRNYYDTWPAAIALLSGGLINLDGVVTHSFPLERATEAFELAANAKHDTLKVQIVDESDDSQ
ncbi:hypothetical protein CEP52_009342 [Fusarium oligoseptatum]|uniref:Enoyl reductase (ER) domain-containing protein n=1 Tax=Fusarium oligoseptatum TaxID=2604345 RepID=A0A428TDJ5_9HYPO|nr:hypothetical protein CEP52_009342 [Fusarium oligoseptatum]